MQKEWQHSELVISKEGYQYSGKKAGRRPRTRRAGEIAHQQYQHAKRNSRELQLVIETQPQERKPINIVVVMGIATLLTFLVSLPLLWFHSTDVYAPARVENELPPLRGLYVRPSSKQHFLSQLSSRQQREFRAKVNFITSIIQTTKNTRTDAAQLAYVIVSESQKAGYDPIMVASVILAESTFRIHARSHKGALGLMQIMPGTGRFVSRISKYRWQGARALRNPQYNVKLGITYLKYLENMFNGNMNHVLIAYNWGPGNLGKVFQRKKRVPKGPIQYSKKIRKTFARWKQEFSANKGRYTYSGMSA